MDTQFPQGISFFDKGENQATFVVGAISINPEKLITWLQDQEVDEKGYIKLQVLRAKETNKPYLKLDTWKPQKPVENPRGEEVEINDVPF